MYTLKLQKWIFRAAKSYIYTVMSWGAENQGFNHYFPQVVLYINQTYKTMCLTCNGLWSYDAFALYIWERKMKKIEKRKSWHYCVSCVCVTVFVQVTFLSKAISFQFFNFNHLIDNLLRCFFLLSKEIKGQVCSVNIKENFSVHIT